MVELGKNFQEHFNSLLNVNNSDMNLIIDIMCHPKKQEGRRFLCLINDIIDYYMRRKDINDEVRYPVLYIPASEAWTQEVCIEFITLKLSLLYNNKNLQKLKNEIRITYYPENCRTKTQSSKVQKAYKYFKQVFNSIKNRNIPDCDNSKNLIVCQAFKKPFIYLDYLCGCKQRIGEYCLSNAHTYTEDCAVSRLDKDICYLDQLVNKEHHYQIKNIFVFLSKSANGHYTDNAYSYQKPPIERLNRIGGNVRNAFFFYFSTKPYKLQRLWNWRHTRAIDILHDKPDNLKDFITLSPAETDYIFNRNTTQEEFKTPIQSEYNDIKQLVDEALRDCEYGIQVRNELAICYDDEALKSFSERYRGNIDNIDSTYFDIYLKTIKETWDQKIIPAIESFLAGSTRAMIILDYFMPEQIKNRIKLFFEQKYHITIDIGDFSSLKNTDAIEGNRIIVLSYHGHYSDMPYSRFPNSFDPIPVGNEKKLLNIIDQFVFDPYYANHRYAYYRILQNVLRSNYRSVHMKADIQLPERPTFRIDDNSDRSITSNAYTTNQAQIRFIAKTDTNEKVRLTQSDYLICKEEGEGNAQIITVETLNDLMQDDNRDFQICKLSDIQSRLKEILNTELRNTSSLEQKIRQELKYNLTEQEIQSSDELWEILLRKKVEAVGSDVVYNDIMRLVPPNEHISKTAFDRWYTPDNGMILPRNRNMQDAVISYLAIDPPYDRIIRRKKAQFGNNTEHINSTLKSFLCKNLLSNDFAQSFNELSDELRDMFDIGTVGDLTALLDLLKQDIIYTKITSITRL